MFYFLKHSPWAVSVSRLVNFRKNKRLEENWRAEAINTFLRFQPQKKRQIPIQQRLLGSVSREQQISKKVELQNVIDASPQAKVWHCEQNNYRLL